MSFLASENARASVVLKYVQDHLPDVGDEVTYEELLGMLDLDGTDVRYASTLLSGVIVEVNKRLHRSGEHRHLVNVIGLGYRVASPAEMREEFLARQRAVDRQQVANLRLVEKVVRHPDTSAAERRRASDAVNAHAALLSLVRREQRKIRSDWPADELPGVPAGAVDE